MKKIYWIALGVLALVACAMAGGTTAFSGLVSIDSGTPNTCTTSTGDGDLCVEGDVEVGTTLTVDGASTLTGAVTLSGAVTSTSTIAGERPWETFTTAQTAAATECGKIFATSTNTPYVTLPAVASTNAGCCYTLVNMAADGVGETGFSINASDAIFGEIANAAQDSAASGTDNQALRNTKATAIKGDRVTLCSDGSTGWFILEGMGIWASVAQ